MPDPTPEDRAAAQAFARSNVTLNLAGLKTALQAAYGDAWSVGAMAGAQTTKSTVVAGLDGVTVPDNWDAYWDAWEPGNLDAALKLDAGGLADLLADADASIRGIEGTTLDRLGSLLAQGALNGDSIDTIADSLSDFIDDPGRAFSIANTETARAVESASQDSYAAANVDQWDWLASPDCCDECQDNADGGPYDVGDGPDLPAHPDCRCASAPVDPGDGGDTSDSETSDTGDSDSSDDGDVE